MERKAKKRRSGRQTQSAADLYHLFPLEADTQCIRLLELTNASSSRDNALEGSLRIVNLQDCPTFNALSYAWGGEAGTSGLSINCNNGHHIPITVSCYDALLMLRELHGPVSIWVDAICINQANTEEKNAQLLLMEQIYTWAEVVYVWLGNGNEKTCRTMEALEWGSKLFDFPVGIPWRKDDAALTMREVRLRFAWRIFTLPLRWQIEFVLKMLFKLILVPFNIARWDFSDYRMGWSPARNHWVDMSSADWHEVFGLGWIERAWTFQEIILASNPILVMGRKQLPWAQFLQAVYALRRSTNSAQSWPARTELKRSHMFTEWEALCKLWLGMYRSAKWNGRPIRPPMTVNGREYTKYSVDQFLTHVRLKAVCLWVRILQYGLLIAVYVATMYILIGVESTPSRQGRLTDFVVIVTFALQGVCVQVSTDFGTRYVRNDINDSGPGNRSVIVGLVQALRERCASDPKDEVFAFHGVLRTMGCRLTRADYTHSIGQIYRQFFSDLLHWDPTAINLLVDAGSVQDTPSWVPNWHAAQQRRWFSPNLCYYPVHKNEWTMDELGVQMSNCGQRLRLRTAIMGTVTGAARTLPRTTVDDKGRIALDSQSLLTALENIASWLHIVQVTVPVPHGYETLSQAVSDSLSGVSSAPARRHNLDRDRRRFNAWYSVMLKLRSTMFRKRRPISQSMIAEVAAHNKPSLDYYTCWVCDRFAGTRRLFCSNDGYMGAGPETLADGDLICIFKGMVVPMIVRRDEATKRGRLLGPAFVPGLMMLDRARLQHVDIKWERLTVI